MSHAIIITQHKLTKLYFPNAINAAVLDEALDIDILHVASKRKQNISICSFDTLICFDSTIPLIASRTAL